MDRELRDGILVILAVIWTATHVWEFYQEQRFLKQFAESSAIYNDAVSSKQSAQNKINQMNKIQRKTGLTIEERRNYERLQREKAAREGIRWSDR